MRSITWIPLCAVVRACLTLVTVSTVSAAEVKFDKVEYFRLRFDDEQCRPPAVPQLRESNPQDSVSLGNVLATV
jgi:hypothetical protein